MPEHVAKDASSGLVPMGSICGSEVTNAAGERLGSITELMVDSRQGVIVYAVMTHGGVLGLGEKLFAVPWHRLVVDPVAHSVRLEVAAAVLAELPGFDKDAWPLEPDPALG